MLTKLKEIWKDDPGVIVYAVVATGTVTTCVVGGALYLKYLGGFETKEITTVVENGMKITEIVRKNGSKVLFSAPVDLK